MAVDDAIKVEGVHDGVAIDSDDEIADQDSAIPRVATRWQKARSVGPRPGHDTEHKRTTQA